MQTDLPVEALHASLGERAGLHLRLALLPALPWLPGNSCASLAEDTLWQVAVQQPRR